MEPSQKSFRHQFLVSLTLMHQNYLQSCTPTLLKPFYFINLGSAKSTDYRFSSLQSKIDSRYLTQSSYYQGQSLAYLDPKIRFLWFVVYTFHHHPTLIKARYFLLLQSFHQKQALTSLQKLVPVFVLYSHERHEFFQHRFWSMTW